MNASQHKCKQAIIEMLLHEEFRPVWKDILELVEGRLRDEDEYQLLLQHESNGNLEYAQHPDGNMGV